MKFRSMLFITILIVITLSSASLAADRVSLGFIYDYADSVELVDRTNGAINQVSLTCLNLDKKGNLVLTSDLTHEFVDAMKQRGVKVTPFLSNHWDRTKGKAAIKNAENLSNQIIEVINEYDLDGINVDIENLTSKERDSLSEFVRILSSKLPADKILSVSVAANPYALDTGWQGSYDYARLGEYADYIFLMAYDEHSQGGGAGAVASKSFVENSIIYALQYVLKDKLVMGMPLYGRYWPDDGTSGGEAIVTGAMQNVVSRFKAKVSYDEGLGTAVAKFSISQNSSATLNGRKLEPGSYTIWYENDQSIKEKLSLVNQYDLLGAGVWALGQEDIGIWEYYKAELNKIPYVSIEERIAAEKAEEKRIKYESILKEEAMKIQEEIEKQNFKNEKNTKDLFEKEENGFEEIIAIKDREFKEKEEHVIEDMPGRVNYSEVHTTIKEDEKKNVKSKKYMKFKVFHIFRMARNN